MKPCDLLALGVTSPDLDLAIGLIQDGLGIDGDGPAISPEAWRGLPCEDRAVVLGDWLKAAVDARTTASLQDWPYLTNQVATLCGAVLRLYQAVKAGARMGRGDPNFAELEHLRLLLAEHGIDADESAGPARPTHVAVDPEFFADGRVEAPLHWPVVAEAERNGEKIVVFAEPLDGGDVYHVVTDASRFFLGLVNHGPGMVTVPCIDIPDMTDHGGEG